MLLANMAVAHKIYSTFPELAVLRRHPHPKVWRGEVTLLDFALVILRYLGKV